MSGPVAASFAHLNALREWARKATLCSIHIAYGSWRHRVRLDGKAGDEFDDVALQICRDARKRNTDRQP